MSKNGLIVYEWDYRHQGGKHLILKQSWLTKTHSVNSNDQKPQNPALLGCLFVAC